MSEASSDIANGQEYSATIFWPACAKSLYFVFNSMSFEKSRLNLFCWETLPHGQRRVRFRIEGLSSILLAKNLGPQRLEFHFNQLNFLIRKF